MLQPLLVAAIFAAAASGRAAPFSQCASFDTWQQPDLGSAHFLTNSTPQRAPRSSAVLAA
jgi:hypothetical protein